MTSPDASPTRTLGADRAFELVGDPWRRRTLAALDDRDGAASLDDLAADVAARVDDTRPGDLSEECRERVAAQLHHSHLPKLADADVVVYDPGEGRVSLTDRATQLEPYFELVDEEFDA